MKCTVLITIFLVVQMFAGAAVAERAQCVKQLSSIMTNVEKNIRTMPKANTQIHNYCVLWLYERGKYDLIKKKNNEGEPCPSASSDWKKILGKLIGAYSFAKSTCSNDDVCSNGCGKALSIIRSGGSIEQALKVIPQD